MSGSKLVIDIIGVTGSVALVESTPNLYLDPYTSVGVSLLWLNSLTVPLSPPSM